MYLPFLFVIKNQYYLRVCCFYLILPYLSTAFLWIIFCSFKGEYIFLEHTHNNIIITTLLLLLLLLNSQVLWLNIYIH